MPVSSVVTKPEQVEPLARLICELHGEDPNAPAIKEPPYMSASGAQIIRQTRPLWEFYAEGATLALLALDRLDLK